MKRSARQEKSSAPSRPRKDADLRRARQAALLRVEAALGEDVIARGRHRRRMAPSACP